MQAQDMPYGYCQCGCGDRTSIANATNDRRGDTKGEPRRFCRGHHSRCRSMPDRFWSHVDVGAPDACWEWMAGRSPRGYGQFTAFGKMVRGHRTAWLLTHGPIPDGLFVCHHCDNPPCCNPAHLFLGTPRDNTRDMLAKGRQNPPSGERHPNTKLTASQVAEIRSLRGVELQRVLAERFGTTQPAVSLIQARKTWK